MKSQVRAKKSASTTLTVEQMRMAGALAGERQKSQAGVEQASPTRDPSLQAAKAGALAAERQKKKLALNRRAHTGRPPPKPRIRKRSALFGRRCSNPGTKNQPLLARQKQRLAAGKQARLNRQTEHCARKNQWLPERIALMATPLPLPLNRPLQNCI
jgi:hypothetical protein